MTVFSIHRHAESRLQRTERNLRTMRELLAGTLGDLAEMADRCEQAETHLAAMSADNERLTWQVEQYKRLYAASHGEAT